MKMIDQKKNPFAASVVTELLEADKTVPRSKDFASMDISQTATERGFPRLNFADYYDQSCSLQLSSLAFPRAIWLGLNDGTGKPRMHLTADQVSTLIPILQYFVEHGDLPLTLLETPTTLSGNAGRR